MSDANANIPTVQHPTPDPIHVDLSTSGAPPETKAVLVLRWKDPYHEPPPAVPYIRRAITLDKPASYAGWPEAYKADLDDRRYAVYWLQYSQPPRRHWSHEAKLRVRRGRLERHLSRDVPLFREEMRSRELSSNPEYYQGPTPKATRKGDSAC